MSGLRTALQAIYEQRGELTPRLVVAEWRNPDHPDHERLEWDDSIAGERFREVQARELIRSVTIVYREAGNKTVAQRGRAFHSVRSEDGHTYRPAEEIALDPIARQIVLMDMTREWRQLKARYGAFAEFVALVQADLHEQAS